jgi:uncharacterized membrane-anchored protein
MSSTKISGKVLFVLFAGIVLLYGWYFHTAPSAYLDVTIHSGSASTAQIYYSAKGRPPSELVSPLQAYEPGETRLLLPIKQESISQISLAVSKNDGIVTISSLRILDRVGAILDTVAPSRIHASRQIAAISIDNNVVAIQPVAGASDARVSVDIAAGISTEQDLVPAWIAMVLLSLVLLPGFMLLRSKIDAERSPVLLICLIVVLSVATLAAVSMVTSHSVNPDEAMHVGAARFYLNNWLPPAIGDPRVATDPNAYAGWGFSYLDEWDIGYFLAGKFAVVLAPLMPDETIRFRLFNVFLFAILVTLFATKRWAYPIAPLLLVSPQVWYVYSYFNGDAFALTVSAIAVVYMADKSFSLLEPGNGSVFTKTFWRAHWRAILIPAFFLAMVVLSKRNFWTAIPFVVLIVLARARLIDWYGVLLAAVGLVAFSALSLEHQSSFSHPDVGILQLIVATIFLGCVVLLARKYFLRSKSDDEVRQTVIKLAALLAIALVIAAPRIVWDFAINGDLTQKNVRLIENENRYAIPELKPETIQQGAGQPTSHFMDRGVPLRDLFAQPLEWHIKTFLSMFGAYGYAQFYTPILVVALIALSGLALFARCISAVFKAGKTTQGTIVLALMFVVVANSVLASWIVGFQAQGRYLMPMLPFAFAHIRSRPPGARFDVTSILLAFCTALGIYSFLCFGLPNLVR